MSSAMTNASPAENREGASSYAGRTHAASPRGEVIGQQLLVADGPKTSTSDDTESLARSVDIHCHTRISLT